MNSFTLRSSKALRSRSMDHTCTHEWDACDNSEEKGEVNIREFYLITTTSTAPRRRVTLNPTSWSCRRTSKSTKPFPTDKPRI